MADTPPAVMATLDAQGLPTGFWPRDIFPPAADGSRNAAIPSSAVAIPVTAYADMIAHPGQRRWDGTGSVAV